jgi:hypothetical protein
MKKFIYIVETNLDGPWKPAAMIAAFPRDINPFVEKILVEKGAVCKMDNIRYRRLRKAEEVMTLSEQGIRLYEKPS